MVISKTKIRGHEVNIVFTGAQYIFQNDFYGLICVANRINYENPEFELLVGNSYCLGGSFANSVVLAAAKRFITKNENKYIKQKVGYVEVENDLNKWNINIKAAPRQTLPTVIGIDELPAPPAVEYNKGIL